MTAEPAASPSAVERRALGQIEALTDPAKVRALMHNARRLGSALVEKAAFRRLVALLPQEEPGTLDHGFWASIHATEEMLRERRGKTVRLSRTRQKIGRVGVHRMVVDLVTSPKPSEGFAMLMDLGAPELTAEAVVLRHRDLFDTATVEAAERRLGAAQVDIEKPGT
jgi:hypothetical protein